MATWDVCGKIGEGEGRERGSTETKRDSSNLNFVSHRNLPTPCALAYAWLPDQVQEALGFEEWEVEASLSEMLLCEEDCCYRYSTAGTSERTRGCRRQALCRGSGLIYRVQLSMFALGPQTCTEGRC